MTDPFQQILHSLRGDGTDNKAPRAAVTALFGGPTGAGKTLAAQAIADELGVALLRIDLSTIVSKYIGETEKNLKRAFDEAEGGGAVLLLDDADALFGKRTKVRDAHDRYANIEVGYLLQRLEEHDGLVILTTNRKKDIEEAFLRRLRFIVDFPPRNQSVEDLKQQLQDYLVANPNACDTQKGIRDWWLKRAGVPPGALAGALAQLRAEGAIARSIRGHEEVWHAPKARLDFTG
jgi:AAA+ superfamily predicted ATPase